MLADSPTTHKRIRPTVDAPSSSHTVPSDGAAKRISAKKKTSTVNGFFLPQLEDFDHWPGLSLLPFDNPNSSFQLFLTSDRYLEAWQSACATVRDFLRDHLLPFFEGLRDDGNSGHSLMLAFVGLHSVLWEISQKISSYLVSFALRENEVKDSRSVEERMDDAIEELDIGEYFGVPSRNDSHDTLGLHSINFESSYLQDSQRTRREFVPGSVPSKRRRTSPEETEDSLLDTQQMSQLSISATPDKHSTLPSTSKKEEEKTDNFFDLKNLENFPAEKFQQKLFRFTAKNILRYFAKTIEEHLTVFPIIAPPYVHAVSNLYETYLNLEKRGEILKDADTRQQLKAALDIFHNAIVELGLAELVMTPALEILCRRKNAERTAVFLKEERLDASFNDLQEQTAFISLCTFVQSSISEREGVVFSLMVDYVKKEYIEAVVESFFDLLLMWPHSRKSFVELKNLIDKTSQDVVFSVIVSLQRQFHSRLLRPGLNTQDILAVYTAAIRALRIVDPSRVIQDLVCEPVRLYLHSRPDTVRCIMSHITHITPTRDVGDSRSRSSLPALDAMIEEEEAAIALTMLNPKNSASDIDMENWRTWQPDPVYVELLPASKRTDRQADTIELLMSIYGGQDVFINEYQLILAEKLLGYYPFDAEEEFKHLKMMTKRFGETLLQKSDVMSRDASDSQKFHNRILTRMDLVPSAHKTIPLTYNDTETLPVKTLIISHHYWPEIRTEKINIPENLQNAMIFYKTRFEEFSETRTIEIRPELGRVAFDLHLDDGRVMHLKCNPVYVAIILHFAKKSRWFLDDLAEIVGLSPPILKKKLVYWQRRNVLEELESDVFSVVVEGVFLSQEDLRRMEDEEIESAVRFVAETNQEEQNLQIQLQLFWKYMTTMLSTVQTITIERLFAMVRMFIIRGQTKKEVTVEHLRHWLDGKVRARELVFANNKYALPKKETKEVPKEL